MADIKTPYSKPGVRDDDSRHKADGGNEERYIYYIPATGEILGMTSEETDADDGQMWGSDQLWAELNPGKVVAHKQISSFDWIGINSGGYPKKNYTYDGTKFVKKSQAVIDANNKADYAKRRKGSGHDSLSYPAITEQLDQIYNEGLDAWKATIKAVKDDNPKP